MKFKSVLVFALFIVAALALSACGSTDDTATTPDTGVTAPGGDATTPADNNQQPIVVGQGGTVTHVSMSEAPHMDPIRQNDSATGDLTIQMFEGLVAFSPYPYNEIVPLLATSWSQPDNYTWEFNIRQGVYFHDGHALTADAFAWSIQRLIDPREAAPGAFILDMVTDVFAVDDHTLRIVTEFPFVPLVSHLTHQVGYVMSPAALANEVRQQILDNDADYELSAWQEEALAWADANDVPNEPSMITHRPIGTGPFRFVSRVSGDHTIMEANPNHWRATPAIEQLIFRVVPDPITRFAMLQTGEAHTLALMPGDVMQLPLHPQIDPLNIAGTGIDYIGFNVASGPLSDVRVRQALTHGLNPESVIIGAYEGIGIPAVGPIGPNVLYSPHDALIGTRPAFDPEAARALLAEAGFADGLDLVFWVNAGNAARLATAEIAQAYWSQIGVNVTIEALEWGVYLDETAAGNHDMFMLGWTTITVDPDYGTFSLFHSTTIGSPGNRTFFANPRVDELLMTGRMSSDSAVRQAAYFELTQILVEEAPWIWLRHPIHPWGSNGLNGFAVDFNNRPHFSNASLR